MKRLFDKRLIFFVLFIVALVAIRFSGIGSYFTLENIKKNRDILQTLIRDNYFQSVIVYMLLYFGLISASLPVATPLTVAGGFFYGAFWAAVYANIGATLGATVSFLAVRYLIGDMIQERYADRLVLFNQEMREHGTSYLLTVHFISVIPFFVINVLAGLTRVSTWTFVWTTSVGIFPGSLVYAFAGQQLTTIKTIADIFSLKIFAVFAALALLALLPMVITRIQRWYMK